MAVITTKQKVYLLRKLYTLTIILVFPHVFLSLPLADWDEDRGTTVFRLPIDGGSLNIANYFDHRGRDWNCSWNTYSGHLGTDFALNGRFPEMDNGVDVVAAAGGVVIYEHDGDFDRCTSCSCRGTGVREGLGNYVIIRHPVDNKDTYYGHLRRDSIIVSVGDVLACGDKIGEVGSSGESCEPHLHLVVRTSEAHNSAIDPYAGSCSEDISYWVIQGEYNGMPSTSCGTSVPDTTPPSRPTGFRVVGEY